MPVKKSRNYYIELLRFIFTIPVIITHFNSVFDNNVLVYKWHGHMSVEFFFVLFGASIPAYKEAFYKTVHKGNCINHKTFRYRSFI